MFISLFSFALFVQLATCAQNDWNTPCFGGSCLYHTQASGTNKVGSTLLINGSADAISDITAAAGWTLVGCDSQNTTQNIRLICTGSSQDCAHIDQGGAEGTIVRLPENCGPMPFARVAKKWVHQNQTLPSSVLAKTKQGVTHNHTVHGMILDTQFDAVDPSQTGEINLYVQGSTASDDNGGFALTPSSVADIQSRGLGSIVSGILNGLAFNITKSNALPAISVNTSFTPFNESISCPLSSVGNSSSFTAQVKVDVAANAYAQVHYGLAAIGKLIPPKLTDFGIFASLDANLDGNLKVVSSASTALDTGRVTVFQQAIPGLEIPAILTIGPVFKVDVQANGTAAATVDLDIDLSYTINNAQIFFPIHQGSSSGNYSPSDTNLQLSVAPNTTIDGDIEGHVIPTIAFGISALGGIAKATIDLDLDTSAKLALNLQASADASIQTGAGGQASGCVDLQAGFAVNAGADASFFSIFSVGDSFTLFSKEFELFNKCFGTTQAQTKRGLSHHNDIRRAHARHFSAKRGTLTCPTDLLDAVSVVNEALQGSSITAV